MSLDLLGDGFDIHGGGQDLAFPHHENERAQAVATGRTFARHWVHNGFVEVGGEKMSKCLGNFTNLLDLIDSTDPRAYRLLVLRAHYRSPVEVNKASTDDAAAALERLDEFARRAAGFPDAAPTPTSLDEFRDAMDDDLDTPGVIALLFALVRRANSSPTTATTRRPRRWPPPSSRSARPSAWSCERAPVRCPTRSPPLATERDDARAAKDWASADRLRDELQAPGSSSRTPRRERSSASRSLIGRAPPLSLSVLGDRVPENRCRPASAPSGRPSPST